MKYFTHNLKFSLKLGEVPPLELVLNALLLPEETEEEMRWSSINGFRATPCVYSGGEGTLNNELS